jgi:hypothetical protein
MVAMLGSCGAAIIKAAWSIGPVMAEVPTGAITLNAEEVDGIAAGGEIGLKVDGGMLLTGVTP